MKYNISKNWVASLDFIRSKPIVLLPFIYIAFLESLALEVIFFSTQDPLIHIFRPVIKKFFGEAFLHYPAHLVILPRLFYYAQVVIYVFFGVFLAAIALNIFKNVRAGLPIKLKALTRNALNRYVEYFLFALILTVCLFIFKKFDSFLYIKMARYVSHLFPRLIPIVYGIGLTIVLFISNVILETFLILALPLMVMFDMGLLKALGRSIITGGRNFLTVFSLILLPLLIYLPIAVLKSSSSELINKLFPEISVCICAAGIVAAVFVDCFLVICAAQFLLDRKAATKK